MRKMPLNTSRTRAEGTLIRNACGRWAVDTNGTELTSGASIEIHLDLQWIRGFIEHDGQAYICSVGIEKIRLELRPGLRVRA